MRKLRFANSCESWPIEGRNDSRAPWQRELYVRGKRAPWQRESGEAWSPDEPRDEQAWKRPGWHWSQDSHASSWQSSASSQWGGRPWSSWSAPSWRRAARSTLSEQDQGEQRGVLLGLARVEPYVCHDEEVSQETKDANRLYSREQKIETG